MPARCPIFDTMKKHTADFLLEICTEELPAGYIRPALERMKHAFKEELAKYRIKHGEIFVYGTATKLVCCIKDVHAVQEAVTEEISGPPKNISFDESGNPTKQLLGFLNAQAADLKDVRIKNTPRGEYIAIEKKIKSAPAKALLGTMVPSMISSLYFPKAMRWDDSGMHFARPVESILVLFEDEQIHVDIGRVPEKKVKKISAQAYLKKINATGLLNPDKRKDKIKNLILSTQKKLGLDEHVDDKLLEEINFMVDEPGILVGEFDKSFLMLPRDVLIASMSKYQRIFSLSKKGLLVHKFIAIINGKGRDIQSIQRNYKNILEARLKDSVFFYNEDIRIPFHEHGSKLKHLIFQKDLGTMFEKIQRLKGLSLFICEKLHIDSAATSDIVRAAGLSKTDLVTNMVYEFPSLQGVMGREYAMKSGEKESVATAIREHYLPQGSDDNLPVTLEGAIVAISDKIDNIVGFLGVGIETKGSFDPYGIRRNAQGLIQIIKDKSFRLHVDELIQRSIELYGSRMKLRPDELQKKIITYIKERLEYIMGDVRPVELKEAVLAVDCSDVVDVCKRMDALKGMAQKDSFLKAAKVVERTSNIIKGAKGEHIDEVSESSFREDLEREVWKLYKDNKDEIRRLIHEERYVEATEKYGDVFFGILHTFFDKVLVNAEDNVLRLNRLAMMQAINRLYADKVADLAMLPQIVVEQ